MANRPTESTPRKQPVGKKTNGAAKAHTLENTRDSEGMLTETAWESFPFLDPNWPGRN